MPVECSKNPRVRSTEEGETRWSRPGSSPLPLEEGGPGQAATRDIPLCGWQVSSQSLTASYLMCPVKPQGSLTDSFCVGWVCMDEQRRKSTALPPPALNGTAGMGTNASKQRSRLAPAPGPGRSQEQTALTSLLTVVKIDGDLSRQTCEETGTVGLTQG